MIETLLKSFHSVWPYHDYTVGKDYVVEDGGSYYRIIIANTCDWVIRGQGCSMCNYSSRGEKRASENIYQYKNSIINDIRRLGHSYKKVKIYINGSFFNENELSYEVGIDLIHELERSFGINEISVESRTEFINSEIVTKYVQSSKSHFTICIGLESVNNDVRELCINKGSTVSDFMRAVNDIRNICAIKVYLLIKPPFLTECEAIDDVVKSVDFLVANGVYDISLTPVAVQENTVLQLLLAEYLYRPIWIWSIIEINSRLKSYLENKEYHIKLSGLDYYPPPLASLFNCEKCSNHLIDLLLQNPHSTWEDLFDYNCDCLNEWKIEVNKTDNTSINDRILIAKTALDKYLSRTEQIIHRADAPKDANILTDIAKLVPDEKISLNKVGIKKLSIPLTVEGFYPCISQCDLSISLDEFHRGIHMSRLVESAYDFAKKTHNNLLHDMENFLAEELKNNMNAISAFFSLSSLFVKSHSTPLSNKYGFIPIPFFISYSCENERLSKVITIKIPIINCCPCTLITSEELFFKQFSHTQKGEINIDFINCDISFAEMIDIFDKYQMISDLLKREDEIYLVKRIYDTPLFCEDICRVIAVNLKEHFAKRRGEIHILVTTEESIHPHVAYSEKYFHL